MRGRMGGMVEDHSHVQTNVTKQPSFRWQLSDFLTLFAAFAFITVGAVSPTQRWAKFAMCVIIGWWIYRCLKAGRQPSGYQNRGALRIRGHLRDAGRDHQATYGARSQLDGRTWK
jgi:hypothetical protein